MSVKTKEKDTVIYTTKDYAKFQVYTFNRGISKTLVKRLKKSIKEIGYIQGKPIIVDKTFTIIDGQHRFNACRELEMPIYYTVTTADPQKAIVELNASQVHWKMIDYVNMYAEQGVKCYQHLLEFESRRKLGINYSAAILFNSSNDGNNITKVKNGFKFQINTNSEKIAEFVVSSGVPYNKTSFFIRAVVKLFKVANAEQIEKIRGAIIGIAQQPNTVSYLAAFENVVNRKIHSKNHVSFR